MITKDPLAAVIELRTDDWSVVFVDANFGQLDKPQDLRLAFSRHSSVDSDVLSALSVPFQHIDLPDLLSRRDQNLNEYKLAMEICDVAEAQGLDAALNRINEYLESTAVDS